MKKTNVYFHIKYGHTSFREFEHLKLLLKIKRQFDFR
jgi:hypothetical protein